jgi:hypothetical protein
VARRASGSTVGLRAASKANSTHGSEPWGITFTSDSCYLSQLPNNLASLHSKTVDRNEGRLLVPVPGEGSLYD